MTDRELVLRLINTMRCAYPDHEQTQKVLGEMVAAYGKFKAVKLFINEGQTIIACPRCKALLGTAKGPGELTYCTECGQAIRLKEKEWKR